MNRSTRVGCTIRAVVDESLRRIELAASLTADGIDIRALNGSAAGRIRNVTIRRVDRVSLGESIQAEDEAQFANGGFAVGVCSHVDVVLAVGEHHVVGKVESIVVGNTLDNNIVT